MPALASPTTAAACGCYATHDVATVTCCELYVHGCRALEAHQSASRRGPAGLYECMHAGLNLSAAILSLEEVGQIPPAAISSRPHAHAQSCRNELQFSVPPQSHKPQEGTLSKNALLQGARRLAGQMAPCTHALPDTQSYLNYDLVATRSCRKSLHQLHSFTASSRLHGLRNRAVRGFSPLGRRPAAPGKHPHGT